MTLYKIFKENEERFIRENDNGFTTPTFGDIDRIRDFHLALIDGVTTETEETYKVNDGDYDTEKPMYVRRNHATNNEDYVRGYNQALSDLKDKLLAERQLINDNK